jgi:hypothetical protein
MVFCPEYVAISLFLTFSPTPVTAFSAFHYAFFLQRCNVLQYYSLSLPLPPAPSLVLIDSPTIANILYIVCVCVCVCGHVCICVYVYLLDLSSTMRENM